MNTKKRLSTWAKDNGVHYRTALAWLTAGTLPVKTERTPGGHIRVIEDAPRPNGRTVAYTRVSSSGQKADLIRQAERMRLFAAGGGCLWLKQATRSSTSCRISST